MSNETNEAAKQPVTDCNHLGNAVKMREALEEISREIWESIDPFCNDDCCKPKRELAKMADAALAAPPRNCDRPECATTKAAQDVWRKEDGGKTAYYEWLLAPHHRPRGHGDERPGGRARADDRAQVRA